MLGTEVGFCGDRNADTLKKLNEAEKKLKEQQVKAYINLELSDQEKELGNQVLPASAISQFQTLINIHDCECVGLDLIDR